VFLNVSFELEDFVLCEVKSPFPIFCLNVNDHGSRYAYDVVHDNPNHRNTLKQLKKVPRLGYKIQHLYSLELVM
jgi:hypothetical protein